MKTHFLPGQDKTRLRSTAKQHNKIGNYLDQRKVQSSVFFDLNTSKYEWKINWAVMLGLLISFDTLLINQDTYEGDFFADKKLLIFHSYE